jgi:TATA-box binding protein (TBP) (component of TFIID and TFIIIB)
MTREMLDRIKHIPSRATSRIKATVPEYVVPMSYFNFPEIPTVYIRNCVSTYFLGVHLNLEKLAFVLQSQLPGKFNPSGFAAMRITIFSEGSLKTVALAFSNGKVVHTGGRSEWQTRNDAWKFVAYLNRFGIPAELINFKIENIVCSFQFGHPINCFEIVEKLGIRASFKPKDIECCFIRNPKWKECVILMFLTGGTVITGIKDRKDIEKAAREAFTIGKSVGHDFQGASKSSYSNFIKRKKIDNERTISKINNNIKEIAISKIGEGYSGRTLTKEEMKKEEELLKLEAKELEAKKEEYNLRNLKSIIYNTSTTSEMNKVLQGSGVPMIEFLTQEEADKEMQMIEDENKFKL